MDRVNSLKNIERIKGVLDYVEEHYQDPLTQTEMADKFHFSASYFARYFKKCTGMTFMEYLTAYRLDQARILLAHGEEPVYQIAMEDYLPGGAVQEEMDKIYVPYYITDNYVPTCVMTCTGDFLKGYAPLMYNKLMECDVPFEFLYFGDKDHELGHVFHLNMKLDIAHECNEAECEFFRRFM